MHCESEHPVVHVKATVENAFDFNEIKLINVAIERYMDIEKSIDLYTFLIYFLAEQFSLAEIIQNEELMFIIKDIITENKIINIIEFDILDDELKKFLNHEGYNLELNENAYLYVNDIPFEILKPFVISNIMVKQIISYAPSSGTISGRLSEKRIQKHIKNNVLSIVFWTIENKMSIQIYTDSCYKIDVKYKHEVLAYFRRNGYNNVMNNFENLEEFVLYKYCDDENLERLKLFKYLHRFV